VFDRGGVKRPMIMAGAGTDHASVVGLKRERGVEGRPWYHRSGRAFWRVAGTSCLKCQGVGVNQPGRTGRKERTLRPR